MRQIHRILCPVDISDVSRHAIAHAETLASWYQAKITALHVCNPVVIPATDFALAGKYIPQVLSEEDLAAVRDQVARLFSSAPGSHVEVLIESGEVWKRILECATGLPADLIVIGTHGKGGFEHLLLGSVTEKVLRKAACPVLTVPPGSRTTAQLPFRRILCAIDFSASSLAALEFAGHLAGQAEAQLTVLHVFEWIEEPLTTRALATPELRQLLEHDAAAKLDQLAGGCAAGARPASMRLGYGKPYREILSVASDECSDLLVMGVHGRNALDLMLFGSNTNQVIRRATCPVLTVGG
jgi:nucleotide-binding universal stress UspA family protein